MATEVRLPQVGMGMTDGTVLEWIKGVGDSVRQGECIAEVEAAKTTVEIEAPCDGVLAEIITPAGAVVPVREVMALIVTGEPAEAKLGSGQSQSSGPPAIQITPAARRLAREHGVALSEVTGSGPGGRITEPDVRAHVIRGAWASVQELTGTRGVIARRMLASLHGSAQYTLIPSADVTDLAARHDGGELPDGISYTDLIARAVVLSLADHPHLNAHISEEQVRILPQIALGLGIDTAQGLLVGVIRDANRLSLAELSARRHGLAQRIRAGQADARELAGSTFTISNLGSAGIDAFTPIINPPEVAILCVGRVDDRPTPSPAGLEWRKAITLSLTVDHRAVDGVPAARFLTAVAARLEDPGSLV